jgi:hypothetical protein
MPLALYTFGIFAKPASDPVNDGFHQRNDAVLALADNAPGLIARSGYDGDPGPASWGEQVYPRFYVERGDGWCPSTLSVWESLESAMAYAYFGLHAEALAHGREWFLKPEWPPYVIWWVAEGVYPTWSDAVVRHEHLHDHGPLPFAFSFKDAFDREGRSLNIDTDKLKALRSG